MNVGIITASDKGHLGEREDRSGARIAEIIEAQGYTVRKKVILPDAVESSGGHPWRDTDRQSAGQSEGCG